MDSTMHEATFSDPDTPRWVRALKAVNAAIASVCMAAAGVLLTALIAIFGWLVFGRYVLNNTPTWVEQASLMIVVWVTFLGAAVGVARGSHLSIEFIRDMMPKGPREALRLVTDIAMAAFGAIMAWQGVIMAMTGARRIVPMIGISESWRAVPVALCGGLIVLFACSAIVLRFAGRKA
jgi:TRAP-type C4-dicarboxylate transport system permease small subunit